MFSVTVLGTLLALAAVAHLVPGWSSTVVSSGSMAPLVRPGDVVVYSDTDVDKLDVGSVIVFTRDDGVQLVHRVVEVDADGSLITRGDANSTADPDRVTHADVRGRAFVLVPWVGLPRVWWIHRDYGRLGIALLVVVVAVAMRRWSRGSTSRVPTVSHGRPVTWLHGPPPAVDGGLLGDVHRDEILRSARASS